MILLSERMIKKIDHLRFYSKLNNRIRLIFVSVVSAWGWYAFQYDILDKHIYTIASLLLTTFIINTISDLLKSEMENILDAIEYDKSKIKYNSLDMKL